MAWEVLAIALGTGALISGAIYFIVFWPEREPVEPGDDDRAPPG